MGKGQEENNQIIVLNYFLFPLLSSQEYGG